MAKNFPFFKFVATEWLTGDIVFEPLEVQGLFINICALYWQRDGDLTLADCSKRYANASDSLTKLTDRFILVNDGKILIKFLDEQLIEASHKSKTNAENGKLGGLAKKGKSTKRIAKNSERLPKRSKEEEEKEKELNKKKKEEEFKTKVLSFSNYDLKLLEDFFRYWSEKDQRGKMRFEKEKVFEVSKRLVTWHKNSIKFNDNGKKDEQPTRTYKLLS